ncbi:MAG: hypothetical protein EKK55_05960 [Rhodocyclaceae bacterium]|nr:MAG: hypothetical protein EKK55_05960 [Rhodocyclaceae bacterium]
MDEEPEDRDFGVYPAFVTKVNDPEGRHRVKVTVKNKISESDWARPSTSGGGSEGRGFHAAPKVGALVFLSFLDGDVEAPVYTCGSWAVDGSKKHMPADIAKAGADAHLVQAGEWRFGDISLRVVIDERPATRSCRVYAVDLQNAEDPIASVELDLVGRGVVIHGLSGVEIRSDGFIQLLAAVIQANERTFMPKAAPI